MQLAANTAITTISGRKLLHQQAKYIVSVHMHTLFNLLPKRQLTLGIGCAAKNAESQ
jgi:hypothetical protein